MNSRAIKRLRHLHAMLTKYAGAWNEFPSNRMSGWQAEYDNRRAAFPEEWAAYCAEMGMDPHHDAGDLLA